MKRLWGSLCLVVAMLPMGRAVAQMDASACPSAHVRFAPLVATHTMPPYPKLSEWLGEEGVTQLSVAIDPHTGSASDVAIDRSSGSSRLDDAAAIFVKQNWQWNVSRFDCTSGFIATRVSIDWHLAEPLPDSWSNQIVMENKDFPSGARARNEEGDTMVGIQLNENGSVHAAAIVRTSGHPDLDAKALEIVNSRSWRPVQMEGLAVKAIIYVNVRWPAPNEHIH